MANTVSNDALWVKLSEIEEKINKCLRGAENTRFYTRTSRY
jgi:hypothetical protein